MRKTNKPNDMKADNKLYTVRYIGHSTKYQTLCDEILAPNDRAAVIAWMLKFRDEQFFPDPTTPGQYTDQNGDIIMRPIDAVCEYDGGHFYARPYNA